MADPVARLDGLPRVVHLAANGVSCTFGVPSDVRFVQSGERRGTPILLDSGTGKEIQPREIKVGRVALAPAGVDPRSSSGLTATDLRPVRPESEWEYRRPVMAGLYWWQADPDTQPIIVDLKSEGLEHRWCARAIETDHPVPIDRGRWQRIDLPSAFEEWAR